MDVRPLPADHERRFHELLSYAFSPEEAFDFEDRPDPLETFSPRALYDVEAGGDADPDDMRACCGVYDFEMRLRESFHRVAGIAAVASPPETRRRGHVACLLAGVHEELREDGVAVAALWPFSYPFYRKLGYGVAGKSKRIELPPQALSDVAPADAGSFRRLSTDDLPAVREVYDSWATETLAVDRPREWWKRRVFASPRGVDPYVYGWERDGRLRGYVVYRVTDPDGKDGRRLEATELAAVDREARDHLLRFCRDHDSQIDTVSLHVPPSSDLMASLSDPAEAEVTVSPGAMVRLVDVAVGLESLAYPEDAEASLTLAVSDDHCPWNDARFSLTVADGRATVERAPEARADATLPVEALSRLAVGSRGAADLAADRCIAGSDAAVATLDSVFPPTTVHLRDGF